MVKSVVIQSLRTYLMQFFGQDVYLKTIGESIPSEINHQSHLNMMVQQDTLI